MSDYLDDDFTHTFIIRLWRESGTSADTAPEWRALIENVNTSTRHPIKDTASLRTFLSIFADEKELNDFLKS